MPLQEVQQWRGKPIVADGWYDGVPLDTYHSSEITEDPSVSSGGTRMLWNKSPRHFFAGWAYNPDRDEEEDEEESKAFILGRAAHHLFLGEDDFDLQFIERPAKIDGILWQSNRTECRDFVRAQKRAGRTILLPSDIRVISGMAKSLAADPLSVDLLQGMVEQTLIARDPETGLWLKARPDVIPTADGLYADLKTTPSVIDYEIAMTLRKFRYNMQGALIWEVCELLGMPFEGFALVFIEKKYPYCPRVIELTDDDLARGRQQNRYMIRLLKRCIDSGTWPGPGRSDAERFSMPKKEQEFIDERLARLEREEGYEMQVEHTDGV